MSRDQLAQAIANIAADYRPRPLTQQIVKDWICQFPEPVRDGILIELAYVLSKTYFSKRYFEKFYKSIATHKSLPDPSDYWRNCSFLQLQKFGNSQKELLSIFSRSLKDKFGFTVEECGACPDRYVYLDDALFSGGRIKADIARWIAEEAPQNARVDVILLARHTQGSFFSENDIAKAAESAGKTIAVRFHARFLIEDRRARTNVSDVLRPTAIPAHALTKAYATGLGTDPILRTPGSLGGNGFFSSEAGRNLLEQEFLKAGVRVREKCPRLNAFQRPLGNTVQRTLGFGSTIVTFRNCPNNAPIALWAGDPWDPLFPRQIN